MHNLETTYLGLKLKNPVIVSSSGLTNSVEKIKVLEENGAGAVVLKSLFEEQIKHEAGAMSDGSDYPEAMDYINFYMKNNSVSDYLNLIKDAKANVQIPVIASINCVTSNEWVDFAKKIQDAGADALEINVYMLPTDKHASSESYEQLYIDLARELKGILNIPFVFKLGRQFTNLVSLVEKLYGAGTPGVVLFNRFYEPDINIKDQKIVAAEVFSAPSDIRNSLRWVGIISSKVGNIEISASTGVHDGAGVVKQILAGAQSVQVCSTLYKNGVGQLKNIISELEQWMEEQDYSTIDSFRGKLCYDKIDHPVIYEMSQFMRYFSSVL